jgi:site-specific DNA recombinase
MIASHTSCHVCLLIAASYVASKQSIHLYHLSEFPEPALGELKKLEQKADVFLERVIQADTAFIIKTYEEKLQTIEAQMVLVREKIASHALSKNQPQRSFEESFRTALEFLQNPYKLWVSGLFSDKQAVLKLAFAGNLSYVRNVGFRTTNIAKPFKFINDLEGSAMSNKEMVEPRGVEPLTS